MLNCLFLSRRYPYCLQQSVVSVSNELASNQEEIDTKVIPHCSNSLNANEASKCILRSPSGDTDIFVLHKVLWIHAEFFLIEVSEKRIEIYD